MNGDEIGHHNNQRRVTTEMLLLVHLPSTSSIPLWILLWFRANY